MQNFFCLYSTSIGFFPSLFFFFKEIRSFTDKNVLLFNVCECVFLFFCCLKLFNILSRKIRFLLKCARARAISWFFPVTVLLLLFGSVFLFLKASRLSDWFLSGALFCQISTIVGGKLSFVMFRSGWFCYQNYCNFAHENNCPRWYRGRFFKSKIGWDQEN